MRQYLHEFLPCGWLQHKIHGHIRCTCIILSNILSAWTLNTFPQNIQNASTSASIAFFISFSSHNCLFVFLIYCKGKIVYDVPKISCYATFPYVMKYILLNVPIVIWRMTKWSWSEDEDFYQKREPLHTVFNQHCKYSGGSGLAGLLSST